MQKTCNSCSADFEITEADLAFYKQMQVPEPKRCPDCRWVRRLMERNSRHLYRRTCDLTGKDIISQYPADAPFPVYSPPAWWGDGWDASEIAQEIDFNRPFFGQFKELVNRIPHLALFVTAEGTMENSEYNNCVGYVKNCYLLGESNHCEDCYYSSLIRKGCKNIVDCSVSYTCERCYDCVDCIECHTLLYSSNCRGCSDSFFLQYCQGCKDCIGCINQRHKQYMIFNEQYSKEEYERYKEGFNLKSARAVEDLRQKSHAFFLTQPHKNLHMEQNEGSMGEHLNNTKNASMCFDCNNIEDCRYCSRLTAVKNSMDYSSWGMNCELIYESAACGYDMYNLKFCSSCNLKTVDSEYCYLCGGCEKIFGCAGLKNKKFCILNKQYSPEEYASLKQKLIEHMMSTGEYGEFFPVDLCPFAYNETIAMDYFPLSKDEALARGYRWHEDEQPVRKTEAAELPDSIIECDDSICNKVFSCQSTGAPYKIIPQELAFYRFMEIPPARFCPNERHRVRMALRNPSKLFERSCANCQQSMMTSYAPDRPEIVFCEPCYLAKVY